MTSETMYNIVQFVRTLMPIFAAIGTVSSVIGFWKMFRKWGKPGVLSLLPFIRGWIFGKDSANTPRLIYAAADGMIVTLTPIFYYIRAYGDLQEYVVGGYTFYVDKAMLIVTAIWAVAEIARFFQFGTYLGESLQEEQKRQRLDDLMGSYAKAVKDPVGLFK